MSSRNGSGRFTPRSAAGAIITGGAVATGACGTTCRGGLCCAAAAPSTSPAPSCRRNTTDIQPLVMTRSRPAAHSPRRLQADPASDVLVLHAIADAAAHAQAVAVAENVMGEHPGGAQADGVAVL